MVILLLVLLMVAAFGGTLWWRRRIDRNHNAFQTKIDLAGDEDYARQQLQNHYNKQIQQAGASREPVESASLAGTESVDKNN